MKLISTNPAKNYEVIGEVEVSSEEEIIKKVQRANLAQKKWQELGIEKRVRMLRKVTEALAKRKEDLAILATREMGMPITQSKADVEDAIGYFKWYLDNAQKYLTPEITYQNDSVVNEVFYEPIGTAAVITPWNFPTSNFVWGCGQNLIVGNTVIFKHSEECPLFGKLLEEIIQSCDLPEGVFSEIYGDGQVGDFLVHQDVDVICFTGSTNVGKRLYKVAAEKFVKVVLEMGGSAPGIIFQDADIDAAVENVCAARFANCGQMCDALKRLLVHESKFDEVVKKMKTLLAAKKVGDPENEATYIGPLVAQRQLDSLELQINDALRKGAKIVIGAQRPKHLKGAYYDPTLLTNIKSNMRVWQEEVFGPVLPIVAFRTEEQALELANDTKYGLGAYVYTQDKEKAARIASQIQTGMVSVNAANYVQPSSPFGGNKQSGLGREHGKFGFAELTKAKVVAYHK